jgi:preprotein translocase subunit SecD
LFTTAQAVNEISRILSGMHRYLAKWPGRAVPLLATQAQTQDRNAALTLAVGLITQCDSVHAGEFPQLAPPMQLSGTAKSYCFVRPTIVDERDIATAEFDQDASNESLVRLTLNDDAAQRLRQFTSKNIGNEVGVVINGQLVLVATIQAQIDQVGITGLAHDVADMVVETFQRRRPVFTFWHLVILRALSMGWGILQEVLLGAASAALPWFLFSVWRTRAALGSAPGTAAL